MKMDIYNVNLSNWIINVSFDTQGFNRLGEVLYLPPEDVMLHELKGQRIAWWISKV